jgi:hypothetical protein
MYTRRELALQLLLYRNILSSLSCITAVRTERDPIGCATIKLSVQIRAKAFILFYGEF